MNDDEAMDRLDKARMALGDAVRARRWAEYKGLPLPDPGDIRNAADALIDATNVLADPDRLEAT